MDKVQRYLNHGKVLADRLGIRGFEPEREDGGDVIWHLRRNPSSVLQNILTIGIYEGHAFFIKNIEKLGKKYLCIHCRARFTRACSVQRHAKTCAQRRPTIKCPNEEVEAPKTAYERAFFSFGIATQKFLRWLEQESTERKIHIHHATCGHGGERYIKKIPVDGYEPITKTVFQYHGCYWHGCLRCFPNDRNTIMVNGKTGEDLYLATLARTRALRKACYRVIEKWGCQDAESSEIEVDIPRSKTRIYPHAIFYDFKAYMDKNRRKERTDTLTLTDAHVPILLSVGDTLQRQPTHICEREPAELI